MSCCPLLLHNTLGGLGVLCRTCWSQLLSRVMGYPVLCRSISKNTKNHTKGFFLLYFSMWLVSLENLPSRALCLNISGFWKKKPQNTRMFSIRLAKIKIHLHFSQISTQVKAIIITSLTVCLFDAKEYCQDAVSFLMKNNGSGIKSHSKGRGTEGGKNR